MSSFQINAFFSNKSENDDTRSKLLETIKTRVCLWIAMFFARGYVEQISRDMTKPTMWLCAQRRLRSAWAFAQSDQSLRCALNGLLKTQVFFMRTAKTLIRLGAQSLCWFCRVAAQIQRSPLLTRSKKFVVRQIICSLTNSLSFHKSTNLSNDKFGLFSRSPKLEQNLVHASVVLESRRTSIKNAK